MLGPVKMSLFNAVVLDSGLEQAVQEISKAGVLHLVKTEQLPSLSSGFHPVGRRADSHDCASLQGRVSGLFHVLGLNRAELTAEPCAFNLDEIKNDLTVVEEAVHSQLRAKHEMEESLEYQRFLRQQVSFCGPTGIGKAAAGDYAFLEVITGTIPLEKVSAVEEEFKALPAAAIFFGCHSDRQPLMVMMLKRDAFKIKKVMEGLSFTPLSLCPETALDFNQAIEMIDADIKALEENIRFAGNELIMFRQSVASVLAGFWDNLAIKNTVLAAREYFKRTGRTYLISGWMPEGQCEVLAVKLKAALSLPVYIASYDPLNIPEVVSGCSKVPVLLKNAKWVEPFEMIVKNYGMPDYSEIDPTFFVAVTFIFMFGAMFGDLGEGSILYIIGSLLTRDRKENIQRAGMILSLCACSSMVFGLLYGSVFAMEGLIPALWVRPMDNILGFLSAAVIFGVSFISLGIILNLVNAVRRLDMVRFLFGKSGLLGGFIYWIVVTAVAGTAFGLVKFDLNIAFFMVIVLSFGLFLRAWVERLQYGRQELFPEGILSYIIEIMIEFIEIFGSLLSNTASFVRVGAFALAHIGLSVAVFTLADIIRNSATGAVGAIIMIVIGNIGIILLEGMVVMMQCLRLEYYEFFSKFFYGDGVEYKPLKFAQK